MRSIKTIGLVLLVLAVLAGGAFFWRPLSFFNGSMYAREALTGVSSRSITVSGYRVHYLAEGPQNGPAVVLVHGLGGSAEDWRNLAPALAHAGFRVYIPDLVGFGRSQQPSGFSYSVRDEANLVIAFMDALGLHQVDLGGWSMGGWIVQLIAADHPDRVKRLMLFDSAGLSVKPLWNTALFTPVTPAELDQLDSLLMPNPPRVPGFVARDILRASNRNGWVIQRAMAQMLTARDVTDTLLPKLNMPVLLVWGDLDRITPIEQAWTMHRLIPQSQFEIASGCGHLAPVQCTDQIAPKLLTFLEQ